MLATNDSHVVKFEIPLHRLDVQARRDAESLLEILRQTMCLTDHEVKKTRLIATSRYHDYRDYRDQVLRFTCRLDQFALFIIRRHEAGCQNLFKELNPRVLALNDAALHIYAGDRLS